MKALVRGLGELFITIGLVLLLFAVYQLWWTNLMAREAIAANTNSIVESWEQPQPESTGPPAEGTGIALMSIPRLESDADNLPVIQGVSQEVLAQGIGHYPQTALPGEVGNFAVAGHRATHGEPLRYIDKLEDGDRVYVETESMWYTYELFEDQIVLPIDVQVIEPQPLGPDAPSELITITTCHPRWASTQRWIWWGKLIDSRPKTEGAPEMVVSS